MFGFLKDKLKQAVKKFSKDAEEEVVEQKVDDVAVIEEAKKEERKIVQRAAPKKKPVPEKKPAVEKSSPKKVEIPEKGTEAIVLKIEKKPKPAIEEPKVDAAPAVSEISKVHEPVTEKEEPEVEEKPIPVIEESKIREEEPDEIIEEPAAEEPIVKAAPIPEKKQGFFGKLFGKKPETPVAVKETPKAEEEAPEEAVEEHVAEEPVHDVEKPKVPEKKPAVKIEAQPVAEPVAEEGGFFGKLKDAFTKKQLSDEKFDDLFWELEIAMLENNVAVEVIEKIKRDLKEELTSGKVNRLGIEDMITLRLQQSIEELFAVETFDLLERIKQSPKPFKLCIIGVNGSGKTTTLAKIIHLLQKEGLSVVVAASDTFRAAAIDQLKVHTDKLHVKLISQGYNADPAAVAFDAIKHAEANKIDVVLIDTAGRLHSNNNLMAELEKVVRVAKPDLKIFVGESITGNDCIEQATVFNERVGVDAIILSKADIDEKGGAAISVSYVTGKPILYLGTGQTYDDLEPFDKEKIVKGLGL